MVLRVRMKLLKAARSHKKQRWESFEFSWFDRCVVCGSHEAPETGDSGVVIAMAPFGGVLERQAVMNLCEVQALCPIAKEAGGDCADVIGNGHCVNSCVLAW